MGRKVKVDVQTPVVGVYVAAGAVYDDAGEVGDVGHCPMRNDVVVRLDKKLTRKQVQDCICRFYYVESDGQERGAWVDGVKHKFVEPQGTSGPGYLLKWDVWEQTQRGDFEAKTEAETIDGLPSVNGSSESMPTVSPIVNGESGHISVVKRTTRSNSVVRSKRVKSTKYVERVVEQFCREADSKLRELEKLSNRNTNTISPPCILRLAILLRREVAALRETVVKDKP
jgi:hypothetical protein